MRIVAGRDVGAVRTHCYLCTCGAVYRGAKPKQCPHCGRLAFEHFDSHAELKRYGELMLLVRMEKIAALKRQVRYPLLVGGSILGTYVADFVYGDGPRLVVEDVKGRVDTALSAWKRKHCEAQYGITINIISR